MDSPSESDNHVYLIPSKLIQTMDDMRNWENSEAYYEYLGFLYTLNDCIKGKTNEEARRIANISPEIDKVCRLLDILDSWIFEIDINYYQENSYKIAFREWYGRLRDAAIKLLQEVVPEVSYRAVPEIMVYLIEGFGNSVRCDYGTGHELSFLMFLCALFKIGFLKVADGPATACKVFLRYLEVVRKLQRTFKMDSVGSCGVWSLHDYQFVPFIWGSSQLIGNTELDPASFLKHSIVKLNSSRYMFFGCIEHINSVKSGPFAEHSNQLWNVSGVSSWSKINSGLIRMYQADILLQFSLVKNVYFGSIFTLNRVEQGASVRRPRLSVTDFHKPTTNVEFSNELPSNRKTRLSSADSSRVSKQIKNEMSGTSKGEKLKQDDNKDITAEIDKISVNQNENGEVTSIEKIKEKNRIEPGESINNHDFITSVEKIDENTKTTILGDTTDETRRTKISVEFSKVQKVQTIDSS